MAAVLVPLRPSFRQNVLIEPSHHLLSTVPPAVDGDGQPRKHEIDRCEAIVEMSVVGRKCRIERVPDLLALEGARRGVKGNFREDRGDVADAIFSSEGCVRLEILFDFEDKQWNVSS